MNDPPALHHSVIVARTATCATCGVTLPAGGEAALAGGRRLRCVTCPEPSEPAGTATAGTALALVAPRVVHGNDAAILALGALVGGAMLVRSPTVRRLATTVGVALKSAARVAWDRLRGRRNTAPAIVRRACEELGPTYVKLGQLVASTQGIFPEAYCAELRGCLDRVNPLPFPVIERVVLAELGQPLARVFSEIDTKPLASASIAQVHAARLLDGTDVVLKVQRPGIGRAITSDIALLQKLAPVLARTARGARANPVAVVDDFAATLQGELDFRREAASMTEFNRILRDLDQHGVVAPRVIEPWTTRRLLVMERFFGTRVDDVEALRARAIDTEEKLLLGMRAWFQGVVFHGFFHGDVHAGNLMALDDGRIGFLDFGIVGRLGPVQQRGVIDTLLCFASGDFRKLASTFQAMGSCDTGADLDALAIDLRAAYEPLVKGPLASVNYAALLPGIMNTAERHGMRLPKDFVLVTKQLLYFDRYARMLAPTLNVFRDPRLVTPLAMDVLVAGMHFA